MKLCVLANLYGKLTLDETLAKLAPLGVEAVELGAGGYPGKNQCNPELLLSDSKAFDTFMGTFKKYGIEPAALACHGNAVHPNKEIAKGFDTDFRNAVLLAEKIGIDTVIGFSGCPGDSPTGIYPNWVTCPWPDDFLAVLKYQWDEVLVPYWKEMSAFCKNHGVRVAFEMHPGFCVYNPETLLKLRELAGNNLGANLDPSHLIWQGMDLTAVIRCLGKNDALYHFHAKDTKIDPINTALNGVLDTKHYGDEINRSWVFRALGYGNDVKFWRDIVSNLRLVGYDGVLSIEHEDSLMSIDEGLSKAVGVLKEAIMSDPKPSTMSWA
ncbi:MAG: sugar phosphate isomerase/epimerase family protein [Eubacteriales bacterium]|jgi:sugar phosphate isomerase/epimerase